MLPTKHHLPTFQVIAGNDRRVRITFHAPCHNLSRWWDAMLRLEAATGFAIPKDAESHMRTNIERFFDNPDELCLVPMDLEGVAPTFYPHSFRENMLALGAMVQYRNSDWAADAGRRMLRKLPAIRPSAGGWDFRKIEVITPKANRNVLVRIPAWVPADSVRLSVNGSPRAPIMLGQYAFVPAGPQPGPITLTHALPRRKTYETTMGHDFVYSWHADKIVGVTPNTDHFPYYPSA